MDSPSIKKNLVLNTLYQILSLFLPFITAPYISRVIGSSGVGVYSYTYSIEMYFSLFAALGTASYGAREIARSRTDKHNRSLLFWEIELLTVITSLICIAAWSIWIFFNTRYQVIYLILTLYLFATMFDISWFYTGMEQFKNIVSVQTIFKLIGAVSIFAFVKSSQDVWIYILIMALSTLLGNMGMWLFLPQYIARVDIKSLNIIRHFKETLVYFIPTIATSVYTILDKTLIGVITKSDNENGYYEQATKIINIAKSLTFTSLNSVLGARISYLFAEKKYEEIYSRIDLSMDYILFMGFGFCCGLIGVSSDFVPLFFGSGYDQVIPMLSIMSVLLVIIGVSNCLGSQYYNPAGLRSKSAKFIIAGSCANLVLNLILIPRWGGIGAVIASIIAESLISALYLLGCKPYYSVGKLLMCGYKKLVAGSIMLLALFAMDGLFTNVVVGLIAKVILGGSLYCVILMALKDTLIINLLSKKFLKKQ